MKCQTKDPFNELLTLPNIHSVTATKANDKIKHFNVTLKTSNPVVGEQFKTFWPFSNVSISEEGFCVECMVRPDEYTKFYRKINTLAVGSINPVAVVVKSKNSLDAAIKNAIKKHVRGNDRVVWGDNKLAIILSSANENTVHLVRERVQGVLSNYSEDISVSIQTG